MAEQPWQIKLEHLALTQDEKNKAEVLIPLRFTTVEERVLFQFSAMHGEIVTSQRNPGPLLLKQSDESHAYPSSQFIPMSHFISFEPLIVPVSMPLPLCRLAIDETF